MDNTTNLKLVDGIFTADDACDILCHLLDKKINYHQCRIFGMEEKFGINDTHSQKRIKELKATKAEMLKMIGQAKAEDQQVEILSNIKLSFTTKAPTATSHTLMETEV